MSLKKRKKIQVLVANRWYDQVTLEDLSKRAARDFVRRFNRNADRAALRDFARAVHRAAPNEQPLSDMDRERYPQR